MNIIEAIIDLLIANIAFVILLVGGIYSVFKRMNETKNTDRHSSEKQMTEKPKQTVSPFGVPAEGKNDIPSVSSISVERRHEKARKMNDRYEKLKQEKTSNRYQDKEDVIIDNIKINKEELTKAVIWSEILSKPKALQKRL
jgi:hypothetical protein